MITLFMLININSNCLSALDKRKIQSLIRYKKNTSQVRGKSELCLEYNFRLDIQMRTSHIRITGNLATQVNKELRNKSIVTPI